MPSKKKSSYKGTLSLLGGRGSKFFFNVPIKNYLLLGTYFQEGGGQNLKVFVPITEILWRKLKKYT